MKVIKKDINGSIKIDTNKGFFVWVDVWKDGNEMMADWNKYIFHLDNSLDLAIKDFQEDTDNFDLATSLAIEYYLKH
jgi:hypothetical protein